MAFDSASFLLGCLASAMSCRCGSGACAAWRCPGCAQLRFTCQGHGDNLCEICDFCWGALHTPVLAEPIRQAAAEAGGQLRLPIALALAPVHLQNLQPWLAQAEAA